MWLIDCGNTRLKGAWYEQGQLNCAFALDLQSEDLWQRLGERLTGADRRPTARVACVASADIRQRLFAELLSCGIRPWHAGPPRSDSLLQLAYENPDELGVDRWLNLRAMRRRHRGGFVLASAGSALTVDVVGADGRHLGGTIAPSVARSREALVARAPHLFRPEAEVRWFSQCTADAVQSGAVLSAAALIQQMHQQAQSTYGDKLALLLTGGGAAELLPWIEGAVSAVEHLVLWGLAELSPGQGLCVVE